MTTNHSGGVLRKALTRVLAAAALLAIYAVSTITVSGVFLTSTTTEAQAHRGRGRGRGYHRGWRGRGYHRGWRRGYWGPPLCHNPWSSRRYYCF